MIDKIRIVAAVLAMLFPACAGAAPLPDDPLKSPMWAFVAEQMYGADATVRFDPRVKVVFPQIAENQHVFPVSVDARAIPGVKRMILFIDLNPIEKALDYRPVAAEPMIMARIKLDQTTPVRAAVQLADGSWLVNGGWIDAAGGGCSAPPASRVKGDWALHLGEIRGESWDDDGGRRVRIAFRHPMDTGFVDNIPNYHIETLHFAGSDGTEVATLTMDSAISEDPVFTLRPRLSGTTALMIDGRDNNGVQYRARIEAPTPVVTRVAKSGH